MKKLYILRGHSGSGKSTYIKERLLHTMSVNGIEMDEIVVISADSFFYNDENEYIFDQKNLAEAHNNCKRKFVEAIDEGKHVIVDNTNTKIEDVAVYIELGQAFGYELEILEFWLISPQRYKDLYNGPAGFMYESYAASVSLHVGDYNIIARMVQDLDRSKQNWPTRWPKIQMVRSVKRGAKLDYFFKKED